MNLKHFKGLVYLGLILSMTALCQAKTDADTMNNLLDMSLSDLMDLKIDVPGTITEKNPMKVPASVTTITAKDIALTPARNILDLMEIYVPGALYMNHSVGPVMGMRGIIADRPYKFLVNVNGINVNIKAYLGARLELLNWDLDDIKKIEIIRGPGSVTYGPGAIGGVINIYTKNPKEDGITWDSKYWEEYRSIGNNVSFSHHGKTAEVYGFFSVVSTKGARPDIYGVGKSGAGYVGTSTGSYSDPPASYLPDYFGQPQIKAHVDFHFKNKWRFWARYNTANSEVMQGNATQYEVSPGNWEDFRLSRFRYFQLALENHRDLDNAWSLKQLYGLSSIDVHDVQKWDKHLNNDKDSLLNVGWAWAEHELFAQYMFHYEEKDNPLKGGFGFETSYDMIRPEWGDSASTGLRLASGIISGPDSQAYGTSTYGTKQYDESSDRYFAVGNGWNTLMLSQLGELNFCSNGRDTFLASYRVDKHQYTHFMFSPRLAWIHQCAEDSFFKLIGQRSVRMNTQEELLMSKRNGKSNDPEILDAVEAIYTTKIGPHISCQSSLFWNRDDVIAWDWSQFRSAPIGTLQTMGLELEGKYQNGETTIGVNHSYVKQLDWHLNSGVTVSGVSYSDYNRTTTKTDIITITSNGNDLSNWANQATKFYMDQGFWDKKITFHGDLVTFWRFQGYKDGLRALEKAGGNAADIAALRSKDAFGVRLTANVALACKLSKNSTLTLYLQNIPVIGDNKRYSYSSGYKNSYPDKTSWVEEPMTFGVGYKLKF